MSKDKSPAFQWYPKDYLTSARVAMMDLKTEGAYRRAMDYCWLNGFLPADEKKLSILIGKGCTPKIAGEVKEMFEVDPEDSSKLIHARLNKEREKQKEFSAKQSGNGSLGGRPRKSEPIKTDNPNESQEKGLGFSGLSETEAKKSSPISNLQSSFPTPVNTNTICALEKKINSFFNLNEIQHYQQMVEVGQFVHHLNRTGKEKTFEPEFDAYCAYKSASGDKIHTLRKFLGSPEKMYSDGGWCADNWQEALKKYQKNGHNQGYTPKTAITTGATRKNF